MAKVIDSKKACTVNPLKMSQPLGAAFAFMGLESCMPIMHGSQGCTSFGLVLLVRHFKEAIPLQTTAMNEVTTILGGYENLETALLNIRKRAKPQLIAICSTGLTETKGDDVDGYLQLARRRKPELADTELVYVSTPDYVGSLEDGWGKAVAALVRTLAQPDAAKLDKRVNLLPGWHLTPADIDELRETIEAFGLEAVVAPDISRSLDGHIPDDWLGTTLGGTTLTQLRELGSAVATIAVGEQMRSAAMELEMKAGVPYTVYDRLTGLTPNDSFLQQLSQLSGKPVPEKYRRSRSQLVDAMLDGHFHLGNVKLALGAEPDLLWAVGMLMHEMGAELSVCVTTTQSPLLQQLPCEEVVVGDLEDMERYAFERDCALLMTHSHGRQMADRLHKPLFRIGLPLFDRVGNSHRLSVGYRGSRNLIFDVANLLIEHMPHNEPDSWPLPEDSLRAARGIDVPLPESQAIEEAST